MMLNSNQYFPSPRLPRLRSEHSNQRFLQLGTQSFILREDNSAAIVNGRFFVVHEEREDIAIDHECVLYARCSSCKKLLPWPLSTLRKLSGQTLSEADLTIAELVSQLDGANQVDS